MPALDVTNEAISEARLRIGAAYRMLGEAEQGRWGVGPLTVNAIERLCANAVGHLRGEQ
jgi:hypothetical protein